MSTEQIEFATQILIMVFFIAAAIVLKVKQMNRPKWVSPSERMIMINEELNKLSPTCAKEDSSTINQ